MDQLTPDHLIADLAPVVHDAPPERRIEFGTIRLRACDRATVQFDIVPRPPAPREPGDELRIAALAMAARGLAVFELIPGKKLPRFSGWPRGIVTDSETGASTIEPDRAATHNAGAVWRRWTRPDGRPADYNVGVFTDELLVLDFDTKGEPIEEAEARLCAELDALAVAAGYVVLDGPGPAAAWTAAGPAAKATAPFRKLLDSTFKVGTPSGGAHYYFTMPTGRRVRNNVRKIGPAIDVRGCGGFVVAPGSRTDKGVYVVLQDHPVMEAPEALTRLCGGAGQVAERDHLHAADWNAETPRGRLDDARRYLLDAATPVSIEGLGGNAAAYQVACGLHDRGVFPGDAVSLLAEHWNPRCEPPWADDDLTTFVHNATAYAENTFACRAGDVMFAGVDLPAPEVPSPSLARVRLFADQGDLPPLRWLVKGLLPPEGVGLLAGQSRVGKSFLAHDICGAVATGAPFFGRRVRERFATLYIAAEGASTAPRRLEALRVHKLNNVDRATLPIAYAALVEPCRPGNVAPFRELVAEAVETIRDRFELRLGLVVLDTVAAAFVDLDENDNSQATQAMTGLAGVAAEFGLFVLAVHHFGKDSATGPRGASGWTASADVVLAATGKVDEGSGKVTGRALALTKARDAETAPLSDFELHVVQQGTDEDGDAITSAIVRPVSEAARAFVRDTPNMLLLRECFDLVNKAEHERLDDGAIWVERAEIQDVWKSRYSGSGPETRDRSNIRRAFNAAVKACADAGTVTERDYLGRQYVRLIGSPAATPADLF